MPETVTLIRVAHVRKFVESDLSERFRLVLRQIENEGLLLVAELVRVRGQKSYDFCYPSIDI